MSSMHFMVHMRVKPPASRESLDAFEAAKLAEREYSQAHQRSGVWKSLWRVVGQYENFSVLETGSLEELHELLDGLPLRRWIDLQVYPLVKHPSRVDDA